MAIQKSEYFSFYSHLAGVALALIGLVVVLIRTGGSVPLTIVSAVYGLSAVFMFLCSTLYHGTKRREDAINAWRKLDHIAIFFMIAGTYTPICYIYLDGWLRWTIIGVQWLLVLLGVFLKVFYLHAPRWLTVTIYILMGWMALIPLYKLIVTMSPASLFLLFAGGVAYSIGALIYAVKKPNPWPGRFDFHDIFHLWILCSAALHYGVVYIAVTGG